MRRAPTSGIYGLLLRLLPAEFRRSFGADMEALYRSQLAELDTGTARLRYRATAWADLASVIVAEWREVAMIHVRRRREDGVGLDAMRNDVRFGMRALLRRPGFTVAATSTLALGIAATVSIFSVVDGVLLDPLPFADSDELVVVWRTEPAGERSATIAYPDLSAIEEGVEGLQVAGYTRARPTLTGLGDPDVVFGVLVTDGLMRLLGVEPHLGRDLTRADDVAGGPAIVVVSHSFWTRRLGGTPDAIGRTLIFDGEPWEVVGVAPPGFRYPNNADIWGPRRHDTSSCMHGCRTFRAVGRLDPGRSLAQAHAELEVVSAHLEEAFPEDYGDEGFELEPMLDAEVADTRTALWLLLGAVATVLLIACANVANLLLVRATGRRAEIGLRAALGASRTRIVRQLLTESALLGVFAGLIGFALAHGATRGLIRLAPEGLPRLDEISIDAGVAGFTAILVALVVALFGTVPALHASRPASSSGRRWTGRGAGADRARSLLLIGEVALSLTLLLGSGLLLRTLSEMGRVDLGFDVERIERFRVSLPEARYDSLAIASFFRELETELARLPGVEAAGWGFGVPLASGTIGASTRLLDRPPVEAVDRPEFNVRPSTPGFLQATGTRLVRGRWFDDGDRFETQPVAVINEAAVRRYYPDRDPIGRRLRPDVSWNLDAARTYTIVGVVEDVSRFGPREAPAPAVYMPNTQFAASTGYMSLRLRAGATTALADARRVVAAMDPELAIWDASTMDRVVESTHAPARFYTTLLSAFSAIALLLAAVGLYGVVAYAVSRRSREIGVRMALGAAAADVTGMVVRQGIRPALIGVGVGLVMSWFTTRLLGSLLFGVGRHDPLVLVASSALLLAVVALAAFLPARRASRVPPSIALRAE